MTSPEKVAFADSKHTQELRAQNAVNVVSYRRFNYVLTLAFSYRKSRFAIRWGPQTSELESYLHSMYRATYMPIRDTFAERLSKMKIDIFYDRFTLPK